LALALGLLVAAAGAVPAAGSAPSVVPDRGPAALSVGAGAAGPSAAPDAGSFAPPASFVVRYRTPTAAAARLVRGFAAPPARWAAGHRGVDLAADAGSAVLAPADGTVAFAGAVAGRGVVTVAHADGRRSSLEPVDPTVTVGQRVAAGEALGTVSQEGWHCTAPCLHWGVREGLDYLDPITLLPGGGPVVLLPDDA